MITINETNKHLCCGCTACVHICPNKCISMVSDEEGFEYPEVDAGSCIGCGACDRVCPVKAEHPTAESIAAPVAIGGYHKDADILGESSSGGAFSLFANRILEENGVVCGCRLNEKLEAVQAFAETKEELIPLRGSKYVQSALGDVYPAIRQFLSDNRKVLFVGTPCQCAGLVSYLGRDCENLIVCDFICHGVPSPKVFSEYIKSLGKRLGETVDKFYFRTKEREWVSSGMQQGTVAITGSGRRITHFPAYNDEFMNGFLSDIMLRPSCYECSFKYLPKDYSDVTIADFWGAGKAAPSICNPRGTSLILLNSEKGRNFFDSVKDDFEHVTVDTHKAVSRNVSVSRSSRLNSSRYNFFNELNDKGYEYISRKYFSVFKWALSTAVKKGWGIVETIIRTFLGPFVKLARPGWSEKDWEPVMQFFKFALVGVSNSVISYTINVITLLLLRPVGFEYDYVLANITAFLISVLWSYNLNSKHVFTVKYGERRSKGKTLLKTYVSYAFSGIVLNNLLGTLWIKGLGISRFVSPLLNLAITVPTNFVLNKYWAYRRKDEQKH